MYAVSFNDAAEIMKRCIEVGITPYLKGGVGIGKSSLVKQFANTYKLTVIDLRLSQLEPTDLNGFPVFTEGKASFVPNEIFPLANRDTPAKDTNGWLLFLN